MDKPLGVRRLTFARSRHRRGVSLVLVMSVILILTVVATGFVAFTSQDMKASQTTYEQNETYFLAESGIDYGLFLLKHNMLIYPAPPTRWTDDRANNGGTTLYDATWPIRGLSAPQAGYTDQRGNAVNLQAGQEHVVIADLGYTPTNNWMNTASTCGTFFLTQSVANASNAYTITFTSTGYIKAIPSGTSTTTTAGYANVGSWTIVAQRTLQAQVTVNQYTTGSTAYPTQIQSIEVKEFNEKFR